LKPNPPVIDAVDVAVIVAEAEPVNRVLDAVAEEVAEAVAEAKAEAVAVLF
jgi:hypothetical protein